MSKKLLSLLLVITMFSLLSLSAYAEEVPTTEEPAVEVPATEEPATEETTAEELATEEPSTETPEEVVVKEATVTLNAGEEFIFTIDETGTVTGIEAVSEEGTLLLEGLDTTDLGLSALIDAIVASYEEAPEVALFVLANDETLLTDLETSLVETYGDVVETLYEEPVAEEEALEESDDEQPEFIKLRFENAELLGITPGKMHLIEKLEAAGLTEINYEEWAEASVKDIMAAIKANKKAQEASEDEDGLGLEDEDEALVSEVKEVVESKPSKSENKGKGKKK